MIKQKPVFLKRLGNFIYNNRVNLSFSIGIGCLSSCYLMNLLKVKVFRYPNLLTAMDNFLQEQNLTWISTSFPEVMILLIGILSLISAPLFIQKNNNTPRIIFTAITIAFWDVIIFVQAITQQNMNPLFIFSITISCILLAWLSGLILKSISIWIRTEDHKIDVVKLTFVWTVIMALWGLNN